MKKYDVIVLGGGPGGYVAAIRSAQLRKSVLLVEKNKLGGVCLNVGCIPTKALLKSAEVLNYIKNSKDFGIDVKGYEVDIKSIVDRSIAISQKLSAGIEFLMKKNKIDVVKASGKINDNSTIILDNGELVEYKNLIIATGSSPRIIESYEPDGDIIWTYKEAIRPNIVPKSMIIIGSGAIGIEFACFYNALGCDVTVLEAKERILLNEDEEIAAVARKAFEKSGIKFIANVKLSNSCKKDKNGVIVSFYVNEKDVSLSAEKILVAVGVVPNIHDIGLEKVKIKIENNYIATDEFCKTDTHNIYAIGDVAKGPWLAHKASKEGVVAAEHICGIIPKIIDKNNIPSCVYSFPQIASIGLSEQKAKDLGYKINVGKMSLSSNGKSLASSDVEGVVKTIFDSQTGELLGAHMVGHEVSEMIHGLGIAKILEATEQELIDAIFAHPTIAEAIQESVLSAFDKAIHH